MTFVPSLEEVHEVLDVCVFSRQQRNLRGKSMLENRKEKMGMPRRQVSALELVHFRISQVRCMLLRQKLRCIRAQRSCFRVFTGSALICFPRSLDEETGLQKQKIVFLVLVFCKEVTSSSSTVS